MVTRVTTSGYGHRNKGIGANAVVIMDVGSRRMMLDGVRDRNDSSNGSGMQFAVRAMSKDLQWNNDNNNNNNSSSSQNGCHV